MYVCSTAPSFKGAVFFECSNVTLRIYLLIIVLINFFENGVWLFEYAETTWNEYQSGDSKESPRKAKLQRWYWPKSHFEHLAA
jgi:hypothetical protein